MLGITLFFIILGYALKGEADIFKYVGFVFLFLLGGVLMTNVLEYRTGEVSVLDSGTTTTIYTYTSYNNQFYGIWISIVAVLGFVQVLFTTGDTNR